MANGLVENVGVIWITYWLDGEYVRMGAKWLHRPRKDGFTTDGSVLFRAAGPGAKSAAGSDDNGGSPFWRWHVFDDRQSKLGT
jgi:hypothetical protein